MFLDNVSFLILVWRSLNGDNDRPCNVAIWLHCYPPVPGDLTLSSLVL